MRRFARSIAQLGLRASQASEASVGSIVKRAAPIAAAAATNRPTSTSSAHAYHASSPCALGSSSGEDEAVYDDGGYDSVIYPQASVAVGELAPDFSAPAVVDGEIKKVSLRDYLKRGKYVVLFFYPKVRARRPPPHRASRKGGKGGGGPRGVQRTGAAQAHSGSALPLPGPAPPPPLAAQRAGTGTGAQPLHTHTPPPAGLHVRVPHRDHCLQRQGQRVSRAQLPGGRGAW
jgi:hypothetical protein